MLHEQLQGKFPSTSTEVHWSSSSFLIKFLNPWWDGIPPKITTRSEIWKYTLIGSERLFWNRHLFSRTRLMNPEIGSRVCIKLAVNSLSGSVHFPPKCYIYSWYLFGSVLLSKVQCILQFDCMQHMFRCFKPWIRVLLWGHKQFYLHNVTSCWKVLSVIYSRY